MTYTGTLTRNFRDIHTVSPKVLMLDIKDEEGNLFRDHCWINQSEVENFIPKTNRKKHKLKFKAVSTSYKTRMDKPEQERLLNLSDITLLRKK